MTPKKPPEAQPARPGGGPFPPGQPVAPGGPEVPTSVVITIGQVKITIEGPFSRVLWALKWLFGTTQPDTVIKSLSVQWGPEVSLKEQK